LNGVLPVRCNFYAFSSTVSWAKSLRPLRAQGLKEGGVKGGLDVAKSIKNRILVKDTKAAAAPSGTGARDTAVTTPTPTGAGGGGAGVGTDKGRKVYGGGQAIPYGDAVAVAAVIADNAVKE